MRNNTNKLKQFRAYNLYKYEIIRNYEISEFNNNKKYYKPSSF